MTIVSAPAGSGKTSLLRAWASRPGRRSAFLTVRPDQQDGQLFWLALLGAITGAEPPPPAPEFNSRAMIDKVRSELAAADHPFFLVIDDVYELRSAGAAEQLASLLTTLPDGVHAVLATRGDPGLRLHRLRLDGELDEIRSLTFTVDETRRLLVAAGIKLPDRLVAVLHERTEGWAAGLRLAVLALAGHPDPERFVAEFSGTERTVAEYLVAEMLERQSAQVQRLLLRTSVLDRVNGQLADLLTGATGSERILLDLEDANAFVVSLDSERTWFRYHHLFRDLLRLELRRTMPAEVHELHRRAARWFAEHGDIAESVRHLQEAGDWTEAAEVLSDHALSLTLDGQAGTVAALVRSFPPDFPGLAVVHAIADLQQVHLDQAAAHLDVARTYAATAPPDRRYRLRTAVASLDLLSARLRGNFEGVFEQVDALPDPAVGRSTADVALGNDLRAIALLNLGVTEAWSLRLAESEKYLSEGAALAREIGRPYLEVACLAHLGFATTGSSFAVARRHCEDAVAQATRHGWDDEPVIAPAYATLAGILGWTGDFDGAGQWLERAVRVTQAGGEPGLQLLIRLNSAILPAVRGRHREALAGFLAAGEVQARMAGQHALMSQVTGWTIATHARLGDVEQARLTLAAVDDRLATTGEIRNATAVLRLAEQQPASAREEVRGVLEGNTAYATVIEAHLLDALACRDLGEDSGQRAALEQALQLAEPDRLVLPFAMTGAWELLESLPAHRTSHAALISDILDAVRGNAPRQTGLADQLTSTELRVLRYLPTNLTRPEIAGQLSVSLNTVNTHIRRIYAKLGATDRSSAVQRARELRLVSSGRA